MHGKCGATYESGSLRRYHLGRTETIRSCTLEAQKFASAMSEKHPETSNESKYNLFLDAIQAQREYTNYVKSDCRVFVVLI
jgi:carnitine O-acetyltransferase